MRAAAAEAVVSAIVGPRSSTMAPTGMASGRFLPAQIGWEDRRIRQIRRFGRRAARKTEPRSLHRRPSPAPAREGEGEQERESEP